MDLIWLERSVTLTIILILSDRLLSIKQYIEAESPSSNSRLNLIFIGERYFYLRRNDTRFDRFLKI